MPEPFHSPPSSPTILNDPIIFRIAFHKAGQLHSMIDLLSTNSQNSLIVEEELETSSNCYCYWSLLYHPRQSIAVIGTVTSVCIVLYLKLSLFVEAASSISLLEGLACHWISFFWCDSFDHRICEDSCHPSSCTSIVSKRSRAVYDVLFRKIEMSSLEEEGGFDICYSCKGITWPTCSLFFDWRHHSFLGPIHPLLSKGREVCSQTRIWRWLRWLDHNLPWDRCLFGQFSQICSL